jgi:hypothetical protein
MNEMNEVVTRVKKKRMVQILVLFSPYQPHCTLTPLCGAKNKFHQM